MTDQELLALDNIGFLPGPNEKEEDFLARVEKTKKKFETGDWIPASHWDWTSHFLHELFNVKPLYICAFYSNRSLTPWQGAASWIEGGELHSIQLRERLRKGHYFGLYDREEILAHEVVHATRSAFTGGKYEEFFAYMTSRKKWRRVLGPIVQRPWEVWPLLVFLLVGVIWEGGFLFATLWIGAGLIRLVQRHSRLKRASDRMHEMVLNARIVRSILFRLTDEEIDHFSSHGSIETYAKVQNSLRWRVIRNYLKG